MTTGKVEFQANTLCREPWQTIGVLRRCYKHNNSPGPNKSSFAFCSKFWVKINIVVRQHFYMIKTLK
jgi:hypothetical protein